MEYHFFTTIHPFCLVCVINRCNKNKPKIATTWTFMGRMIGTY